MGNIEEYKSHNENDQSITEIHDNFNSIIKITNNFYLFNAGNMIQQNESTVMNNSKNNKQINPKKRYSGKVLEYNESTQKGTIFIKNIKDVVHVNINDVKNYPQLTECSKVTCNIINVNGIYHAKNIIAKPFRSFLHRYLICVGFILFILFGYFLKIKWGTSYILTISIITYIIYYIDKKIAKYNGVHENDHPKKQKPRVEEKVLHYFEFAGGWFCALFAQRRLPHKLKSKYQEEFQRIVILNLFIIIMACFLFVVMFNIEIVKYIEKFFF